MKRLLCALILLVPAVGLWAVDFARLDALNEQKQFSTILAELPKELNAAAPDPAIIWRISRAYYYTGLYDIKVKKDKLAKFGEGIAFCKPYQTISTGTPRDRAQVVYWYAVLCSISAQTKGIKESLDVIPGLRPICDASSAIDPTFGDPYYLKAKINDGLPTLFGGDKFQMVEDYAKALSLDPENLSYLIDFGNALKARNWSVDKKKEMAAKKGRSDGSPADQSDADYAKALFNLALERAKTSTLTIMEKEKMTEIPKQ